MSIQTHAYLVVLYKTNLEKSESFQAIQQFSDEDSLVILYDNSPKPIKNVFSSRYVYISDPRNLGLAVAYNAALKICEDRNIRWLTIFDQDTHVPPSFFKTLNERLKVSDAICLIPRVLLNTGKRLSPFFIEDSLFLPHTVKQKTIAAINSGMTLNTEMMMARELIFDVNFPLDFLDYSFFFSLSVLKLKIEQYSSEIIQDLSVSDYSKMSLSRFKSFYLFEDKFVRVGYPEKLQNYKCRLLLRWVKSVINGVEKDKREVILSYVWKGKS